MSAPLDPIKIIAVDADLLQADIAAGDQVRRNRRFPTAVGRRLRKSHDRLRLFLAHEIQALRLIGRPGASGIDHFDLFKTVSQCSRNPFMWKRKLPYCFVRKFVIIPFPMFKDFDVPVEYSLSTAQDLNDDHVPIKLARPYRPLGESAELAESINVENKNSVGIEMQR